MVLHINHINNFHTRKEVLTPFCLLLTTKDEIVDISEVVLITHSLKKAGESSLQNPVHN